MDETCLGEKRRNLAERKRAELSGRDGAGKTAVVGVKDRGSKRVSAAVVQATDQQTLQACVAARSSPGATVYSVAASACAGLSRQQAAVQHGPASSNGLEPFRALLKRECSGTCHRLSPKHLNRSVQEFVGRHNVREQDTLEQLREVVRQLAGQRLRHAELIQQHGLAAQAVQGLSCERLRPGVVGPPQPLAAAGAGRARWRGARTSAAGPSCAGAQPPSRASRPWN